MTFSFVQIADPQFGMHSHLSGFDNPAVDRLANLGLMVEPMPKAENMDFETANYGKVIDAVNRLRPAFVATCGDMTNDQDNPFEEHAELMHVTAGLSDDIPMHWVSGNHDVRGQPTHESLARYRGMYGDDVYSFDHEDSHFVVLNSTVIKSSANVEDECERQLAFLEADLREAREKGSRHMVVFTHHPPFLVYLEEAHNWLVLPPERRLPMVDLFLETGVTHVFSGHWHRNHHGYFKELEIVVTSAVGVPLGPDPSGLRVVQVGDDGIRHKFFSLDDLPDSLDLGAEG